MNTTYSVTALIADIKLTNNGRLLSHTMTAAQKRAAEKAVARGLVVAVPFTPHLMVAGTAYSLA